MDASGPGVETPESPVEAQNPVFDPFRAGLEAHASTVEAHKPPVALPGPCVEAPGPSGEPPGASVETADPSAEATNPSVAIPGPAVEAYDPSGEPPGTPVVSTNALDRWCELSSRTARRHCTDPRPSRIVPRITWNRVPAG